MRRLILCLVLACTPHAALADYQTVCGGPGNDFQCFAAFNYGNSWEENRAAINAAKLACAAYFGATAEKLYCSEGTAGANSCLAVAFDNKTLVRRLGAGDTRLEAFKDVMRLCDGSASCRVMFTVCDGRAYEGATHDKLVTTSIDQRDLQEIAKLQALYDSSSPAAKQDNPPPSAQAAPPPQTPSFPFHFGNPFRRVIELLNASALGTGISFGVGLVLVLLLYAMRAQIANFVIHKRLPYKLPVYGQDIRLLIKRTQRVNWYGRVVFGIVVNLAMTAQQLHLVRKYWLGRVIAFDSLRRQRQNELARMHLQLAASKATDPHERKATSQLLVFLKRAFLFVFYVLRSLFSFLFGFLFIRVTVSRLVRGTVVESKDLVLLLQAKEAIEQSAAHLKEYLTTAETFDDRDEVYDP